MLTKNSLVIDALESAVLAQRAAGLASNPGALESVRAARLTQVALPIR